MLEGLSTSSETAISRRKGISPSIPRHSRGRHATIAELGRGRVDIQPGNVRDASRSADPAVVEAICGF